MEKRQELDSSIPQFSTSPIPQFAYFKDKFLEESECHISIHDRSFRFGDGIFDTCLVKNGQLYDFANHKARFENGLAAYKIDLDTTNLEHLCAELIKKNSIQSGYVRMIVSRGENPPDAMGYLPKDAAPYLLIQTNNKPYPAFKEISLFVSSQMATKRLPSKTNNSLAYTLALIEAQEQHCDNALLLNKNGQLCETASGNIFWIKDNVLYTPADDLEIIPGTMRAKILQLWEGEKQLGLFTLKDLQNADEVFMSNVGCILAPVTNLYPIGNNWSVGKYTQLLRGKLDSDIIRETA